MQHKIYRPTNLVHTCLHKKANNKFTHFLKKKKDQLLELPKIVVCTTNSR
jgi:hypothetical protein